MMKSHVLVLLLLLAVLSTFQRVNAQETFERSVGKNCSVEVPRVACGDRLICNPSTNKCDFCTADPDCTARNPLYQCQTTEAFIGGKQVKRGICRHKDLFPRVVWQDVLAALAVFIGGTLSGAGGIGGGGIFVPLLNIIGQFSPSLAVPLSKATIFGGAVCNVLILSFERHPSANRPLIDYDTTLMLEPATLLGTIIGVYFNVLFPNWLTVILLILVLGNATWNLGEKTIAAMRKETNIFGSAAKAQNYTELKTKLLNNEENKEKEDGSIEVTVTEDDAVAAETLEQDKPLSQAQRDLLERILEEEKGTSILKLMILAACWLVVLALSLLKGGHGAPSVAGIQPCTFAYWFVGILAFPIITAISVIVGVQLIKRHEEKVSVNYPFKDGDVHWTRWNTFYFPFLCAFAGTMAALLGIGGGMIKGPVLLDLGLDPHVASATSSLMILFTASIVSAQYLVLGRLPLDYGLMFASLGFLSSLLGQLIIGYPARKYKLTFIIIGSITIATLVATALMGGLGLYNIIVDLKEGVYMGFHSLC